MELGTFSVSLNVSNLADSKTFYENLGFASIGGDASQGWLIMRNGGATIGLFHGMFDRNLLTFNPGWSPEGETLSSFADVREIQRELIYKGITLEKKVAESESGPGDIMVIDPDGNPILIDQHV
ncbi:MAG: VOC family protein [Gammaproteobacteria bacterium]|nr:VOC family protein [Gammaproteobacteria bacterium]